MEPDDISASIRPDRIPGGWFDLHIGQLRNANHGVLLELRMWQAILEWRLWNGPAGTLAALRTTKEEGHGT